MVTAQELEVELDHIAILFGSHGYLGISMIPSEWNKRCIHIKKNAFQRLCALFPRKTSQHFHSELNPMSADTNFHLPV